MTSKNTIFPLNVGKERNMTLPKDFARRVGLQTDEMVTMVVADFQKIVTSQGRVIESDELSRLLSKSEKENDN